GQRTCIGKPFAMQEAIQVLASALQRFDLTRADSSQPVHVDATATLKLRNFFIQVKRRPVVLAPAPVAEKHPVPPPVPAAAPGVPIHVWFGPNSGSAEAFAQRIATDARMHGYAASINTLDASVGELPREGAVVIVAASYEGQPTDNARQFVPWVEGLA